MNMRVWSAAFVGRLEGFLEAQAREVELFPWIVGAIWGGVTYLGGLDWLSFRAWLAAGVALLGATWALRWVLPAAVRVCARVRWRLLDWKRC